MKKNNGCKENSILVLYCPPPILDLNIKYETKIALRNSLIDIGVKFRNGECTGVVLPNYIKTEILDGTKEIVVDGPPQVLNINTENKHYIEIQEYINKVLKEIKEMVEGDYYSVICPNFLKFRNI